MFQKVAVKIVKRTHMDFQKRVEIQKHCFSVSSDEKFYLSCYVKCLALKVKNLKFFGNFYAKIFSVIQWHAFQLIIFALVMLISIWLWRRKISGEEPTSI